MEESIANVIFYVEIWLNEHISFDSNEHEKSTDFKVVNGSGSSSSSSVSGSDSSHHPQSIEYDVHSKMMKKILGSIACNSIELSSNIRVRILRHIVETESSIININNQYDVNFVTLTRQWCVQMLLEEDNPDYFDNLLFYANIIIQLIQNADYIHLNYQVDIIESIKLIALDQSIVQTNELSSLIQSLHYKIQSYQESYRSLLRTVIRRKPIFRFYSRLVSNLSNTLSPLDQVDEVNEVKDNNHLSKSTSPQPFSSLSWNHVMDRNNPDNLLSIYDIVNHLNQQVIHDLHSCDHQGLSNLINRILKDLLSIIEFVLSTIHSCEISSIMEIFSYVLCTSSASLLLIYGDTAQSMIQRISHSHQDIYKIIQDKLIEFQKIIIHKSESNIQNILSHSLEYDIDEEVHVDDIEHNTEDLISQRMVRCNILHVTYAFLSTKSTISQALCNCLCQQVDMFQLSSFSILCLIQSMAYNLEQAIQVDSVDKITNLNKATKTSSTRRYIQIIRDLIPSNQLFFTIIIESISLLLSRSIEMQSNISDQSLDLIPFIYDVIQIAQVSISTIFTYLIDHHCPSYSRTVLWSCFLQLLSSKNQFSLLSIIPSPSSSSLLPIHPQSKYVMKSMTNLMSSSISVSTIDELDRILYKYLSNSMEKTFQLLMYLILSLPQLIEFQSILSVNLFLVLEIFESRFEQYVASINNRDVVANVINQNSEHFTSKSKMMEIVKFILSKLSKYRKSCTEKWISRKQSTIDQSYRNIDLLPDPMNDIDEPEINLSVINTILSKIYNIPKYHFDFLSSDILIKTILSVIISPHPHVNDRIISVVSSMLIVLLFPTSYDRHEIIENSPSYSNHHSIVNVAMSILSSENLSQLLINSFSQNRKTNGINIYSSSNNNSNNNNNNFHKIILCPIEKSIYGNIGEGTFIQPIDSLSLDIFLSTHITDNCSWRQLNPTNRSYGKYLDMLSWSYSIIHAVASNIQVTISDNNDEYDDHKNNNSKVNICLHNNMSILNIVKLFHSDLISVVLTTSCSNYLFMMMNCIESYDQNGNNNDNNNSNSQIMEDIQYYLVYFIASMDIIACIPSTKEGSLILCGIMSSNHIIKIYHFIFSLSSEENRMWWKDILNKVLSIFLRNLSMISERAIVCNDEIAKIENISSISGMMTYLILSMKSICNLVTILDLKNILSEDIMVTIDKLFDVWIQIIPYNDNNLNDHHFMCYKFDYTNNSTNRMDSVEWIVLKKNSQEISNNLNLMNGNINLCSITFKAFHNDRSDDSLHSSVSQDTSIVMYGIIKWKELNEWNEKSYLLQDIKFFVLPSYRLFLQQASYYLHQRVLKSSFQSLCITQKKDDSTLSYLMEIVDMNSIYWQQLLYLIFERYMIPFEFQLSRYAMIEAFLDLSCQYVIHYIHGDELKRLVDLNIARMIRDVIKCLSRENNFYESSMNKNPYFWIIEIISKQLLKYETLKISKVDNISNHNISIIEWILSFLIHIPVEIITEFMFSKSLCSNWNVNINMNINTNRENSLDLIYLEKVMIYVIKLLTTYHSYQVYLDSYYQERYVKVFENTICSLLNIYFTIVHHSIDYEKRSEVMITNTSIQEIMSNMLFRYVQISKTGLTSPNGIGRYIYSFPKYKEIQEYFTNILESLMTKNHNHFNSRSVESSPKRLCVLDSHFEPLSSPSSSSSLRKKRKKTEEKSNNYSSSNSNSQERNTSEDKDEVIKSMPISIHSDIHVNLGMEEKVKVKEGEKQEKDEGFMKPVKLVDSFIGIMDVENESEAWTLEIPELHVKFGSAF